MTQDAGTNARSVLLVDDEPAVLEGLRRRIRQLRKGWDVAVAQGGRAAVSMLEARSVDAVITDVRMADVDGLAVLRCAEKLQPHALRVVLSGQLDSASAAETAALAHHCLSKPCSAEKIVALIEAGERPPGAAVA
jgi:DNA-binding NtrC family response regulator